MTERNDNFMPEVIASSRVRIEQNKEWTDSEFIVPPPKNLIVHNTEAMNHDVYYEMSLGNEYVMIRDFIIEPRQPKQIALINALMQHRGQVKFKELSQTYSLTPASFKAMKQSINETFSMPLRPLGGQLILHRRHGDHVIVYLAPNIVIVPDDEIIKHYYLPDVFMPRINRDKGLGIYGKAAYPNLRSDMVIKAIADRIEQNKLIPINELSPSEYSRALTKGWLSTNTKPVKKRKK